MFNHKRPMTAEQADYKFDAVLARVDCTAEVKQRFVSARHAVQFLRQQVSTPVNEYAGFIMGLTTALEILQAELD